MSMKIIYKLIRGEVIHTTSADIFAKIVVDKAIMRGMNENPCGFCQHKEGLAKHLGPCTSLTDLSLSSDDRLTDFFNTNWDQQIVRPYYPDSMRMNSRFIPAMACVTIVLDRGKLDPSKHYTWERIKEEIPSAVSEYGYPSAGRFILEAEVCYADDIPMTAFKRLIVVCSRSTKHYTQIDWDYSNCNSILDQVYTFEKQMQNLFPPKEQWIPIQATEIEKNG